MNSTRNCLFSFAQALRHFKVPVTHKECAAALSSCAAAAFPLLAYRVEIITVIVAPLPLKMRFGPKF